MNTTATFLAGALVLGLASASAQTGTTGTQVQPPKKDMPAKDMKDMHKGMAYAAPLTPARASEIIGQNIEDSTGKDIAEIKDLVVCDSGEVYAVVEADARDDALFAVPLNKLQARCDEDDKEVKAKDDMATTAGAKTPDIEKFALIGDRTLFDSAPVLKDAKNIDEAWLKSSRAHYDGKKADGMKDGTAMAATKPACVKRLIGEDVKGTGGDGIGDVKDLAIDLRNSHVAYAIVSSGGVLGVGDSLHAIPFERLTLGEDSVSIPMTKDGVSKLPKLDMERLPAGTASIPASGDLSDHGTDRKDG
jgi:sporulation protein YlmC with PRC-barrel domain